MNKEEIKDYAKEIIDNAIENMETFDFCIDKIIVVLVDKVNQQHQALLDIKEYIERNKGSWEVSTFSQREDVRKIVWTNEELDILDIVNKALGGKE